MKYFFTVQGEGRGHMTQAISLKELLTSQGHEVVHVVVGKSRRRNIPEFFTKRIGVPVSTLRSPNFVTDKDNKSVKPFRTVVHELANTPIYRSEIHRLGELIDEHQPDVIVNFYDFLAGIYNFFHRPKALFICIGHQYLLNHPEFVFPKGRPLDKTSLLIGNKITSLGTDRILALSFREFSDLTRKKLWVVPPLIRSQVKELEPESGEHLLVYMVNPGYGEEVERFHEKYPDVPLVCFWDMPDKPNPWKVDETLIFHQLDDVKFLENLASSRGYVSTAGFESICEAMYLGKPVMMIPVRGHYEQACNALDGENAGAGISHHEFDISKLLNYISDYKPVKDEFRQWESRNIDLFLKYLTEF